MRRVTIQQYCNEPQYTITNKTAKDGLLVEKVFKEFVCSLIHEHGDYRDGTIQIYFCDLPSYAQQEYLKQFLFFDNNIEEWEHLIANPSLIPAYINEYESALQHYLDKWSDEVYCDIQEEFAVAYQDSTTGERLWRRQ